MQLLETSSQMDYYKAVISKLANIESFEVVKDLPGKYSRFELGLLLITFHFLSKTPRRSLPNSIKI